MATRIKICGITNAADATVAVDAGAHALGFVFYPPSARFVSYDVAKRIIEKLPPLVTTVAVVVNLDPEDIHKLVSSVPVDLIQLHGDEPPELCDSYHFPYIKGIRAHTVEDAADKARQYPAAEAYLFDSLVSSEYGGTGESLQWQRIPEQVERPVFLAGGLDADNVCDAIARTGPYAVDVSSGVEASKGIKDEAKIRRFISAVQSCAPDNRQTEGMT